jgi:hypothetical protein
MSKGLEAILDRIRVDPKATLIDRYLSLVADMSDEAQKQTRALDLAELLMQTQQDQALQVAHMVYKSDRNCVRALDVMIEIMNARGRYAKAEVLKLERDKLLKANPQARRQQAEAPAQQRPKAAAGEQRAAPPPPARARA